MRIACLNAVKHVPSLGRKAIAEESTVTTLLWMALHDPDKVHHDAMPSCYKCFTLFVLFLVLSMREFYSLSAWDHSYQKGCVVVIVSCRGCRRSLGLLWL